MKKEELKQQRLRTRVLEHMTEALEQAEFEKGRQRIPEQVLVEAAKVSSPAVADLGANPLIERVTSALSAKS